MHDILIFIYMKLHQSESKWGLVVTSSHCQWINLGSYVSYNKTFALSNDPSFSKWLNPKSVWSKTDIDPNINSIKQLHFSSVLLNSCLAYREKIRVWFSETQSLEHTIQLRANQVSRCLLLQMFKLLMSCLWPIQATKNIPVMVQCDYSASGIYNESIW